METNLKNIFKKDLIIENKIIGKGAFGEVFYGKYKPRGSLLLEVAIKVIIYH